MHPNPSFRKKTGERNIEFAKTRSFGTLAVNADEGPLLSHIPFLLSEDNQTLEFHLVRSNPILRELSKPKEAVISVLGGDSYISPDWYLIDDQVPTWNYIAVHLRGEIKVLPQNTIHNLLDRQSAFMEERLLPKPPWKSEKMDQDIYQKMLRQIVPVKMQIREINGTWKLSQNKTDEVRHLAAKGVVENGIGSQLELLSALMKEADE